MKKIVLGLLLSVVVGTVFAGVVDKQKAREELIAKMGGMVLMQDKDPGIVFLNCQNVVPASDIDQALVTVRKEFFVSCFLKNGEYKGINDLIQQAADKTKIVAIIAVVCNDELPKMLVAADDRVAVVNIKPLMIDNPSPEKLRKRVWLMAYRAFGVAMGAAWTAQGAGLMQRIEKPSDLDRIQGLASAPDSHFPIDAQCRKYKVAHGGYVPYRDACLDGWAPAPTNEIQKAIWEGVKSGKIKD